MKTHPFIYALCKLAPEAAFTITRSRDWCSMTFSGQQLTISCELKYPNLNNYYNCLIATLPEHEFSIPRLLVADITVVTQQNCGDGMHLVIEALVISA